MEMALEIDEAGTKSLGIKDEHGKWLVLVSLNHSCEKDPTSMLATFRILLRTIEEYFGEESTQARMVKTDVRLGKLLLAIRSVSDITEAFLT